MPVMTDTASNGHRTLSGTVTRAGPTLSARRRQMPWVVGGVLLVVGCALAFAVASLHLSSGEEVLVVSHSVPVGTVVSASDLQTAKLTASGALQSVPATEESSVVGRPAAVPLVAGTMLTTSELGTAAAVTGGSDLVAVGLKAGQYPPSLSPGDRVRVVPVAVSTSGTTSSVTEVVPTKSSPVSATVVALDPAPAGSASNAVASLEVAATDADRVAQLAASGDVSLVQLPPRSSGS